MDQQDKKDIQKVAYTAPVIESEEVLEQAALLCTGVFSNSLYNYKDNSYSCGYNDS